jgi:hypothetical protein
MIMPQIPRKNQAMIPRMAVKLRKNGGILGGFCIVNYREL